MSRFLILVLALCNVTKLSAKLKILSLNHPNGEIVEYFFNPQRTEIILEKSGKSLSFIEAFYFAATVLKVSSDGNEIFFKLDQFANHPFVYRTANGLFWEVNSVRFKVLEILIHYRQNKEISVVDKVDVQLADANGGFFKREYKANELKNHIPLYEFQVGIAANIHQNHRKNDQRKFHRQKINIEPIPIGLLRIGPFFANKDGAGALLLPFPLFSFLGTFLWEGEPYQTQGIHTRRSSLYVGPLMKSGIFELHYYFDLWDRSNGHVLKLTAAPTFSTWAGIEVNPRVYLQWWDDHYMDYYYQVSEEEQALGLYPVYNPKSNFNYGFLIQNTLKVDDYTLLVAFGRKFFGPQVRSSPLTARSGEWQLIMGATYHLF